VQRISRDHLALEVDQPLHLEPSIDLIAVLGRDRGERQPEARRIGRDHHSGRALLPLVVGPLQQLAVDGDHTAFGQRRDKSRGDPSERGIERFWVQRAQHGRERVVRRDAMLELQEALEKLDLLPAELGHLRAAPCPAQHRDEGDDEQLDEVVPRVLGARIGNTLERGDEELHGGTPKKRSPLKNPRFATLQVRSAQVICDSPA
jgi:hypothetical protein